MKAHTTRADRYHRYGHALATAAKWPLIGALIGTGVLIVGQIVGPRIARQLGTEAGEGFARGMIEAQGARPTSRSITWSYAL